MVYMYNHLPLLVIHLPLLMICDPLYHISTLLYRSAYDGLTLHSNITVFPLITCTSSTFTLSISKSSALTAKTNNKQSKVLHNDHSGLNCKVIIKNIYWQLMTLTVCCIDAGYYKNHIRDWPTCFGLIGSS